MTLNPGFIKFAFAGTGTANDINSLLIILIIFLALFLVIPYMIAKIRRYWLKHLQNGDEINKNIPFDIEGYDEFD